MSLRLDNATIVTMNDAFEVLEGSVSIRGNRIAAVGAVASMALRWVAPALRDR